MGASFLVHKNYRNANMEGYDFRKLIYLVPHPNPEIFLYIVMTKWFHQ